MKLPHTVTIVTPVVSTDRRRDTTRDYGAAATRTVVRGWMQQTGSSETSSADRDDQRTTRWRLFTVNTPDMTALERVEWNGDTFLVDGDPNHLSNGQGDYHHTEAELLVVEG